MFCGLKCFCIIAEEKQFKKYPYHTKRGDEEKSRTVKVRSFFKTNQSIIF